MAEKLSPAECDRILTQAGSPMETEEKYMSGRRMTVWKNLSPSFRECILTNYQKYHSRTYLASPRTQRDSSRHGDSREYLTFGDVLERSLKLAAWMRSRGIKMGDKVAIGGRNCSGWVISWSAAHLLGAVTVCLNAWQPKDELIRSIMMVDAKIVLLDEERAELLGLSSQQTGGLPPMYCWSKSNHLASTIDVYDMPQDRDVKDILEGKGLESLGPESDAVIFFSSGTSGRPKAVLSTQRAALSNIISGSVSTSRALLRAGKALPPAYKPTDPQRAVLLAIPMFHVTGCLSWLLRAIMQGSKVVMMMRWDVQEAVRLIVEEKVNAIGGVPAIASQISQSPDLPEHNNLDSVLYGGAPSSKQLGNEIHSKWPNAAIIQGYGLTETNAIACAIAGDDYLENPTSTGAPVPICQVRIVHETTRQDLPTGQTGLILIRGANVMKCYYGDKKATESAIDTDGWFDSGDVGCIDGEGFLYVKDRLKDMIIRGGENVASMDVENAVTSHPDIDEVAAVALPHPVLGEVVGVIVTLREGRGRDGTGVTEDMILEHVRPRLPRYAVPAMVMLWEGRLPRNVNGKIIKKDLKEIAAKEWGKRQGLKEVVVKAKL